MLKQIPRMLDSTAYISKAGFKLVNVLNKRASCSLCPGVQAQLPVTTPDL
jgi:hypothetical protein